MKSYKIIISITFLFVTSIIMYIIGCSQKNPVETKNEHLNLNAERKYNANELVLTVPDTIPTSIDQLALKHADELNCDGIRILLVSSPDEAEKYYVTYFNETEMGWDIKDENFILSDGTSEQINTSKSSYLDNALEKISLKKALYYVCWDLAEIFVDANYGGSTFRFSQATTSSGYYHKIINNLNSSAACCRANYNGGFNDCVSSHRWTAYNYGSYSMVPDYLHVWKDANRSGANYTFDNGKERYDNNWEDEKWWENGVLKTINDKVSSLDMAYRVY